MCMHVENITVGQPSYSSGRFQCIDMKYRHQETLQEKARLRAHMYVLTWFTFILLSTAYYRCQEQITNLPDEERERVHQQAHLTQAHYRTSKCKELMDKEWVRHQKHSRYRFLTPASIDMWC